MQITNRIYDERIQPILVKGSAIVEMTSAKVRSYLKEVTLNEQLHRQVRKAFF